MKIQPFTKIRLTKLEPKEFWEYEDQFGGRWICINKKYITAEDLFYYTNVPHTLIEHAIRVDEKYITIIG